MRRERPLFITGFHDKREMVYLFLGRLFSFALFFLSFLAVLLFKPSSHSSTSPHPLFSTKNAQNSTCKRRNKESSSIRPRGEKRKSGEKEKNVEKTKGAGVEKTSNFNNLRAELFLKGVIKHRWCWRS